MPPGLRKSGMPDSVLMPAPVNTTARRATSIRRPRLASSPSLFMPNTVARRSSPVDPGDAQDVGRTRRAERHPGGDHDALAGLGDLLALRRPHRLLHHVVEVLDIGEVDAMRPPQQREAA